MWYYSFIFLAVLHPSIISVKAHPHARQWEGSTAKRSFGVPRDGQTFDYVVVGGGAAGLTIASRLAEDASLSVAVIEAGGFCEDAGNTSVVPAYDVFSAGTDPKVTNPAIDWGFVTTPQKGADNRQMHYTRGKTLGGSSARNSMYYHRQNAGSARRWAIEAEDQSYNFKNLLPFYEKSVKYTPPSPDVYTNTTNEQNPAVFSANGGPLHVSGGGYSDPFASWALRALRAVGHRAIQGFQSGILIGSSYVLHTVEPVKGTRSSSEASFLQQALNDKTKLTVFKNTMTQRIIFNGKTATGVSVVSSTGDKPYTIKASREVILSAGAFQSPQLLMVSGIGPLPTLRKHNIPVVRILPGVGQNLQDHPFFASSFRVNVLTASAALNNPVLAEAAALAWRETGKGPLSIGASGVVGFEKLTPEIRQSLSNQTQMALKKCPDDWPELEWVPTGAYFGKMRDFATEDPMDGYNYASLAVALVAPLSRGSVTISSASMHDAPVIDPNWLTHPGDKEVALAAFKRQREIWSKLGNVTLGEEYFPGKKVQTDEEILAWIADSLAPISHPASTCKMGRRGDRMAVVDSQARVFGVKGLRVVDASAFPFLPPGHPQATVYALAEKVASLILGSKE